MDKVEKLPSEIKTIWKINAFFDFFIFLIIFIVLLFLPMLFPTVAGGFFKVSQIVVGILAVLVLVSELVLITYRWNFWTYYIDERQVELHKGFFFRKQVIIPIARVQNVTLKQGPILRIKDLQKIIIVTAAGQSEIEGIKSTQAEELKEIIMKLAQEAKNDI
ncbi:PH domain-containing protein [Companilactobacillus baiquanensis]|uniref:PH domain-containing protein n=1 Tax=Companilactobacillus baiquanensis TaxID=2486005 RepID=A0ABW1USZ1_9LACO|nr:PH domain-containing protein [Companilactobacillus baiquanensis]